MTYTGLKRRTPKISALIFALMITPGIAVAASISTDANLGVPDFSGIGDGEFNNGPLTKTRVEHDGTLIPASGAFSADVMGHSDIGAGTLSSVGEVTSGPADPPSEGLDGGVVFGESRFSDDVVFTNSVAGPFDVTLNLYVTGEVVRGSSTSMSGGAFLSVDSDFEFGDYATTGSVNDVVSITFTVTDSDPVDIDASISYSIDQYAGGGDISSVELYAVLELVIDGTVTYESESTMFLTTPVPIPAALPMLTTALAGIFFVRRQT